VGVASFRLGTLDGVEAEFQHRFERIRTARTAKLEAVLDRLLAGEVDAATLARLSLTPTESQVAMALFKGQSVKEYAQATGISIGTARWYVKQIHAKTGVRSQTQLFQLLLKSNGVPGSSERSRL
jgi:DNA-binding CsgD family transcriptional regulator